MNRVISYNVVEKLDNIKSAAPIPLSILPRHLPAASERTSAAARRRMDDEMNDHPRVRIDSLAFGGDGVGRLEGKVCFVPFTCPGDLAAVRLLEERTAYLRAQIVELLEPGPSRREARCSYFSRCGGCHWQHIDYESQLAAKEEQLAQTMRRIAHLDPPVRPIIPSDGEFGYRTRARLRVASDGRIGYFARGSTELVAVAQCPILVPSLDRRLGELAASPSELRLQPALPGRGGASDAPSELELLLTKSGGVTERLIRQVVPRPAGRRAGIRSSPARFGPSPAGGEEDSPFHQVNRFVNERLVEAVGEAVEGALPAGRPLDVVDLYCGDGNLSLPLASRARRVTGFDTAEESIREAAEQARSRGLTHAVYSRMGARAALEELITRAAARGKQDAEALRCIIADPPRIGLRDVTKLLLAVQPDLLIYVSCNPPTLARDARLLVEGGLELRYLLPFDMFPQTFHLETLALFSSRR